MLNKLNIILISLCATTMWLLAGLWHKVIMLQFYTRETGASHEGTLTIFIAYLVLAMLMVYLYRYYQIKHNTTLDGFRFGAVIGLLWVFPHELAMAGAHGESIRYVFLNAGWHIFEQGIGGMLLAWLPGTIGRFNK